MLIYWHSYGRGNANSKGQLCIGDLGRPDSTLTNRQRNLVEWESCLSPGNSEEWQLWESVMHQRMPHKLTAPEMLKGTRIYGRSDPQSLLLLKNHLKNMFRDPTVGSTIKPAYKQSRNEPQKQYWFICKECRDTVQPILLASERWQCCFVVAGGIVTDFFFK